MDSDYMMDELKSQEAYSFAFFEEDVEKSDFDALLLLITLSDGNLGSDNDVDNNQSSTSRRILSTERSKGILDTEPPAGMIWQPLPASP